jgi:5-(carboxyamino)imidazole ribonucleotide synthase
MVNLLGQRDSEARLVGLEQAYLLDDKVHVHFYGKSESKIARKMGHFTVVDDDLPSAVNRAQKIKSIVKVM